MAAYILTVKLPRNKEHDPSNKITAPCPVSQQCTDSTGQHHSTLVVADSEQEVRDAFSEHHITRIELV